jgi:FtsH-binding integral membrane protein
MYQQEYSNDANHGFSVAQASVDDRSAFIVKTYLHLFAAIVAFIVLEVFYFVTPIAGLVFEALSSTGRMGWLAVMAGFVGISWIAEKWANGTTSQPMQYAGLALYTFAESLIFIPMIGIALMVGAEGDTSILPRAAGVTLAMFGSLTGIVLITRKDFSFMRGILMFGGIASVITVVASLIFGFSLGNVFSYLMIALACGYILFHTSNVLHSYRTDQYVAASLALFASVALLFWYVLRIFLSRRD